jgi:hypothetical protein
MNILRVEWQPSVTDMLVIETVSSYHNLNELPGLFQLWLISC